MDSIINELIKIDRKAKEAVAESERRQDETRAKIVQEKLDLYNASANESAIQIEILNNQTRKQTEADYAILEKRYIESQKKLDDNYNANHEDWIKKITEGCLDRNG